MLTLRPTKVFAKRLDLVVPAEVPVVANRVADWCVHEFRESRYRYLLFWNTASFFPLLAYARGVTDEDTLIKCFVRTARETLTRSPWETHYQSWIAPEVSAVQWAPVPDRSHLGTINDFIRMAKWHLEDGLTPQAAAWRVAKAPMSVLGMNSPDRAFSAMRGPRGAPRACPVRES